MSDTRLEDDGPGIYTVDVSYNDQEACLILCAECDGKDWELIALQEPTTSKMIYRCCGCGICIDPNVTSH